MFGWISLVFMFMNAVFRGIKQYLPYALPVVRLVAAATKNQTDDAVIAFLEANGVEAGTPMTDEVWDGLLLAIAAKLIGEKIMLETGKILSKTRLRSIAQFAYDMIKMKAEVPS